MNEIRKLETLQKQLGDEANRALDILHKEIGSHRLGTQGPGETIAKLLSEIKDMQVLASIPDRTVPMKETDLRKEIVRLHSQGCPFESLEKKLECVQSSIDKLVCSFTATEGTPDPKAQTRKSKMISYAINNSPNMSNLIRAPCSPLSSSRKIMDEIGNRVADNKNAVAGTLLRGDGDENSRSLIRENTPTPQKSNSINVKKMQKLFKNAAEDNIQSIKAYVTELKERVAKLQYQKQLLVCQVLELEDANEATTSDTDAIEQSPLSFRIMFEQQRKQIVMLWHLCHVSLVHRTQFYLLFRGDAADEIYMEVELRRLTWLEQHLSELGNASPALLGDEPASYVASSIKALKQEREHLAKRVSSKLTMEEREDIYVKWDIPPEGKQRRRMQLVNKIWTDPHNMQHVHDSAQIVAKLVGFCESGDVKKEMFELNFRSPTDKKTWMGWNLISNLLHL